MAKKLAEVAKLVEASSDSFYDYLERTLDDSVFNFLKKLSDSCDVYIFSGIIRNYFLKRSEVRDVDIIIDGKVDIETVVEKFEWRKNSFGGYKVIVNNTPIDIWYLENTWALHYQRTFDFDLVKFIPGTAFFNFSAIVYHFNESKFFYSVDFLQFLRDKKIDLAFAPNANTALCVVNSFYYSDKLKLELGSKLKSYIKLLYRREYHEYDAVQVKHFGRVLYSKEVIDNRIARL